MGSENPYIGSYFGNYQITSMIDCGSFGCVYRAQHTFLPRIAAVKLLHAARLHSHDAYNKFLQEAQLLEKLKHPHILPIYEFGIDKGLPYLVTAYAFGGSLRGLLRHRSLKPLSLRRSIAIVSQIGDALYFAHLQGVIHHDLKPGNILFNSSHEALLADFGIAIARNTATLEQITEVNGTPTYMAPEQFQGKISRRSDQYSLGCIAYELVTGRPPFTAPDTISMGFKHAQQYPIPPTRLNPSLSPQIEQVILKALEKRRINRHPDVLTFIKELQLSSLLHVCKAKEQFLNDGMEFFSFGRYGEALAAFEQAIRIDPDFIDAHFRKGNALYILRHYEEALDAFEQAINLAPHNAGFHNNKGSVLYSLGRYREALAAYDQALRIDNHLVSSYRGRSLALRRLGRSR